jgi:hypothetical protein
VICSELRHQILQLRREPTPAWTSCGLSIGISSPSRRCYSVLGR